MLFRKKSRVSLPEIDYDPEHMQAILKCNTCNPERVAGFKDTRTGEFTEVMNIRSDMDLADFKSKYGIADISEVYGW